MSCFVRCTLAAASITLTFLGCQDAATPLSTANPVPVAFVTLEPPTANVPVGQTVQLTATTRDADQKVLTEHVVTWASGNTALATVSSAGLVTGVAVGQTTITATSEGKSGTATVNLTVVPVASVIVAASDRSISVGQTAQLTATLKDATGNVLADRVVTWTSNNTDAATVNASGLVTGVAAGAATITGTTEGKSGTAAMTVTARPTGVAFFDDFNEGTAARWEPMGGIWSVVDGQYEGQETEGTACMGFAPNQSIIRDVQARDVDVEVDMTSLDRVDKGLILRSAGPGDQIELNFRAERPDDYPADVIVQEISGCERTLYTPEFSVIIPHQVGQTIHVRVRLVGSQLTVWIDGALILDDAFPFASRQGRLGVALLGVAQFDNVAVRVLDGSQASRLVPVMVTGPR